MVLFSQNTPFRLEYLSRPYVLTHNNTYTHKARQRHAVLTLLHVDPTQIRSGLVGHGAHSEQGRRHKERRDGELHVVRLEISVVVCGVLVWVNESGWMWVSIGSARAGRVVGPRTTRQGMPVARPAQFGYSKVHGVHVSLFFLRGCVRVWCTRVDRVDGSWGSTFERLPARSRRRLGSETAERKPSSAHKARQEQLYLRLQERRVFNQVKRRQRQGVCVGSKHSPKKVVPWAFAFAFENRPSKFNIHVLQQSQNLPPPTPTISLHNVWSKRQERISFFLHLL